MKGNWVRKLRVLAVSIFFVTGGTLHAEASGGTTLTLSVPAPSLAGNLIGDPSEVSVVVYLPRSYASSPNRRYPAVYQLDGFDDRPRQINRWHNDFDELMGVAGNPELIVVEPDQFNGLFGSLFVNSPVIGRWEDFVVHDLISFVESNFRILSSKDSRAITGFYTGGGAALRIAMTHPDVFSEVFVYSPTLLKDGGLKEAMRKNFFFTLERASGAAFSPDLTLPKPYAAVPKFDGSEGDALVVKKWEAGYGNLAEKVQAFQALGIPLRAMAIHVGANDAIPWVYEGSLFFSDLLKKAGIGHVLDVNPNGGDAHELAMSPDSGRKDILPFFRDHPLIGQ